MSPATSITAATVLAVALAAFPVAIDRDTGMPGAKLSVAQEAAEEDHPDDDADHDEDHDEATDGDHPDDDADHDEATDGDHPDDDADHPPDAPDDPPPDEPPEDEPPPDDPPPDDPPADEPPPPDEPLPVELPGEIGPAAPPVEEFGGLEALLDLAPDVAAALEELPPETLEAIADIPPEVFGAIPPETLADLPPQSLGALAAVPPEVFEALPPEVFGFGFGPAGDPGELLGQAAANALALQADADQMILDARAADADPNRLELLNATAKRMSAAATELAVVVARAEGLGDEISALGAQRQRANQAVDAARAALETAPERAGPHCGPGGA